MVKWFEVLKKQDIEIKLSEPIEEEPEEIEEVEEEVEEEADVANCDVDEEEEDVN